MNAWKLTDRKDRSIVVLSHESSRCQLSWYCAIKIAARVLKEEPGNIDFVPFTSETKWKRKQSIFYARWQGKPGGGLDELRLEYKRSNDQTWERMI